MEEVEKNPKGPIVIFKFPMCVPEEAVVTEDISSLDHLELWKTYQLYWCEH